MKTITRAMFSLCLALAAGACDSERESDNAGCDSGRNLEATVVALVAASEGECDAPMLVAVDLVDAATGEAVESNYVLFGGPVPQAWLDEQSIEVGAVLDAFEYPWCVGGGLDLDEEGAAPSC